MRLEGARRITRGLRFRLTLSYALFFTLLLVAIGMIFQSFLAASLDTAIRNSMDQDFAAMKGFLEIKGGTPNWNYDRDDDDEHFIVSRITRVFLISDAQGEVVQSSNIYASIGEEKPEEVRAALRSREAIWKIRKDEDGVEYLLRSGVFYSPTDVKHRTPYYVAIGRSLADSQKVVRESTETYFRWVPVMIFGVSLLGWLVAGRALKPVTQVAMAAQRISGSNLTLRIPRRGAGDELDYLIETFNRMVERLESSFNQMRQFSTDVSHELRTPITAIRGQLEVALFTAKDAEQYREAILNSLQDVERLSQIVRALLLLSQAESGQVALNKAWLDLSASVRDIIDQFQIPAEEAQIRLIADLPDECPVEVDRVQIERMISNLISNAVKFTPAGGEVKVSLKSLGSRVDLIVDDTGRGIAPEHLPHVFERFYQAPGRDVNVERGLGLGLSFVNWIAKAHGGSVAVESVVNSGSRFRVSLPVAKIEKPQPQLAGQASSKVPSA